MLAYHRDQDTDSTDLCTPRTLANILPILPQNFGHQLKRHPTNKTKKQRSFKGAAMVLGRHPCAFFKNGTLRRGRFAGPLVQHEVARP